LGEFDDGNAYSGFELRWIETFDVDGTDSWGSILDRGRERETDGHQRGAGLDFRAWIWRANQERGTTRNGLGSGHAKLHTGTAGGGIGADYEGFFARTGEERGWPIVNSSRRAKHGVKGEVGDVKDSEHGPRASDRAGE
jgi:hypothetical protein